MTKHIEEKAENLCRLDNHISGNSGNSNKYAIKKSSVRKALTTLAIKIHEEAIKELEGRKKTLVDEVDTFTPRQIGYNKAIDEATTYHREEIIKVK